MNKSILKDALQSQQMNMNLNNDIPFEEIYQQAEDRNIKQFEKNCRLGIKLMLKYKQIAAEEGLIDDKIKGTFFITIRPDTSVISFEDFYKKVSDFVSRKCFVEYTCSFEQKGTDNDSLGKGFHVHIIAQMKQRSKGEVLRDTQSTFKESTSANCIQVDILKTNKDLENTKSYILEYSSDDGHKMPTKQWDELWRNQMGLQSSYQNSTGPLPTIKSGVGSVRIREITAVIPL